MSISWNEIFWKNDLSNFSRKLDKICARAFSRLATSSCACHLPMTSFNTSFKTGTMILVSIFRSTLAKCKNLPFRRKMTDR